MSRLYIVTLLGMAICLNACAKRDRQQTVESTCVQSITQVNELLESNRNQLDTVQIERITNLIAAAKIDHQHKLEAQCLDKTSRARQLAAAVSATSQN